MMMLHSLIKKPFHWGKMSDKIKKIPGIISGKELGVKEKTVLFDF